MLGSISCKWEVRLHKGLKGWLSLSHDGQQQSGITFQKPWDPTGEHLQLQIFSYLWSDWPRTISTGVKKGQGSQGKGSLCSLQQYWVETEVRVTRKTYSVFEDRQR